MSTKSLYVGNIPYSVDSEALTTAFSAYGGTNVRIVEGRGFAFIDVDSSQMDSAIETMNGKSMEGRTLVVNEARPRDNSGGGGGGGGSRSGSGGGGGGRSSYGGGGGGRGNRW